MLFLLLPVLASPRPSPPTTSGDWSASQATGSPDVKQPGDSPRAWASAAADAGHEWLEVVFPESVVVAQVRIRENDAPGAVVRVVASDDDVVIWEGKDPTREPLTDLVVEPSSKVFTNRVRIELDTRKVPGWNEIDAVELVGTDGKRQWAASATASSTYGSWSGPVWTDPWAELQGRRVRVLTRSGTVLEGRLGKVDDSHLVLEERNERTSVARDAVDAITWSK